LRQRELGQAEVKNLDPSIFGEEQVVRFQVTMDDAFLVRCCQPARDLLGKFNRLAYRHGTGAQTIPKRLAFQKLGHDIGRALVLAEVVNGQNVGMVQSGGGAATWEVWFEAG
jgi:hypothetical protein